VKDILSRNLARVEERLAAACRRAGRDRAAVRLVAVTKYVDSDVARRLWELGVSDLGESRPQELWRKAAAVPEARWHLVGHLQRNKVAATLPLASLLHSADSTRLLAALEAEAAKQGRQVEVLLEFNLSGEEAKHGFHAPDDLPAITEAVARLRHVRVAGLMTMAAQAPQPEAARPTFARLLRLRDEFRLPAPHEPRELSMGMTGDFEVAVEEGATLVRIGSALFEGLEGQSS
jgi:hypothetical protein